MAKAVLFLHIPKTGGTTLRDIINRQYVSSEILELNNLATSEKDIARLSDDAIENFKIIMGHFTFGLHKKLRQNAQYFALMREPVARIISAYEYSKTHTSTQFHKKVINLTIEEYLESGVNTLMDNGQTRLLAGLGRSEDNAPYGNLDEKYLQVAKENIKNDFLLIGTMERYNEFLLLLQGLLKWKTPYYSVANKTKEKKKTGVLDPKSIDKIKQYNKFDIEIYSYVSQLFEEKISAEGENFTKKLIKFNKKNNLVGGLFLQQRAIRLFKRLTQMVS